MQNGWNVTGDTYLMDDDGYFWYQARSDDMIISAGYNIAGPEVEAALLTHAAVAECGVVGAPDEERGQIVKAYVVLRAGHAGDAAMTRGAAGAREGDDRAVQISARDRVCQRAAEDPDRQAATLRAAAHRSAGRDAETCILKSGMTAMTPSKSMPLPGLSVEDEQPRALQPKGWPRPSGYANGMTARGRIIVTGGVVGWDVMGNFPPTFAAQARQTFSNIMAILGEGGAGPEHLVRLTWYVVDLDEYRGSLKDLGRAYREVIGAHYPAMAVVQVTGLVEPKARLEIEATAVVPE